VNAEELLAKPVLPITVKPGAAQTEILGVRNETLHVALKAAPVEGKANEELLKFLKKQTGKEWELISGATSKRKLLRLK
jgi:uncharacterized protein